jgi:hypothetical protein
MNGSSLTSLEKVIGRLPAAQRRVVKIDEEDHNIPLDSRDSKFEIECNRNLIERFKGPPSDP